MAGKSNRPVVLCLEDRSVPATLSGLVFADVNANSIQDAGETGLSKITVQLDAGGDGIIDQFTTTDAAGIYTFTQVPDGINSVIVIAPVGTSTTGTTTRVAIVAGGADTVAAPVALTPNGAIRGQVYADLDRDGQYDPGEPGLAGVTVLIDTDSDGGSDFSLVTDSDGNYEALGVRNGTHKVIVVPPVNYLPTTSNPQVLLLNNGSELSANFGLRPATSVSGRVSLFSRQSPIGLEAMAVQLDLFSDGKIDQTTTTSDEGYYSFANLPNGTHTIKVVVPPGSVVDSVTGTATESLLLGSNPNPILNFGVTYPGSVAGSLFLDVNGNTKRDLGEAGLTAATFQVDLNRTGTMLDVTARSTGDGSFVITGLPDGDHALVVNPGGGYGATNSTRLPFTIADGSSATVAAVGVRANTGSTLTVGGSGGSAITYTFAQTGPGTVTANPARTVSTLASGSRVVTADFNGDGIEDTIAATGPGTAATIRVLDGKTGLDLVPNGIRVFELSFTGGLNIAAADFNHDGKADIVVSADTGGGPRVQILNAAQFQPGADPAQGKVFVDFLGIDDANFRGGTRVAAGDLNGDGTPDLVVAAGQGGGPRVALFDGRTLTASSTPTRMVGDFFVYESGLRNGATVAVGDVNGDGLADLVAGAGPGGAPRVTVFSGAGVIAGQGDLSPRIADFFVMNDVTTRNGTRITVKDIDKDGKGDLIATNGGRAFAYTAANISAYYVNPIPGQSPLFAAELIPFGNTTGTLSVG